MATEKTEAEIAAEEKAKEEEPKTFTQEEVNRIAGQARAEGRLSAADGGNSTLLQQVLDDMASVKSDVKNERRERRRDEIEKSAETEPEKRRSLEAVRVEERRDEEESQLNSYAVGLGARMYKRVRRAIDAGVISEDHPTLVTAKETFASAATRAQYDGWYEDLTDFLEDKRDEHSTAAISRVKEEVVEDKQANNRANDTMNVGAGVGSGNATPRATEDDIDRLYMEHERKNPNTKNPYEDQYRTYIRTGQI